MTDDGGRAPANCTLTTHQNADAGASYLRVLEPLPIQKIADAEAWYPREYLDLEMADQA